MSDGTVRYALRKERLDSAPADEAAAEARSRYELVRHEEGCAPETVLVGEGLAMRLQILTYLTDIGELGGPDSRPALEALKAGWTRVGTP